VVLSKDSRAVTAFYEIVPFWIALHTFSRTLESSLRVWGTTGLHWTLRFTHSAHAQKGSHPMIWKAMLMLLFAQNCRLTQD